MINFFIIIVVVAVVIIIVIITIVVVVVVVVVAIAIAIAVFFLPFPRLLRSKPDAVKLSHLATRADRKKLDGGDSDQAAVVCSSLA
ncbi:hypothetical protein SLS55_007703 [Diplodia seriata]|uniref:Uncharacterized protein n=1 Tax=Diplodia seriata TaxID=420778 RepID=A0ABR3C8R7_9PEZI